MSRLGQQDGLREQNKQLRSAGVASKSKNSKGSFLNPKPHTISISPELTLTGADSFQQLSDDFEQRPLSGGMSHSSFCLGFGSLGFLVLEYENIGGFRVEGVIRAADHDFLRMEGRQLISRCVSESFAKRRCPLAVEVAA